MKFKTLFILSFFLINIAFAQENNVLSSVEKHNGWQLLFNGTDLNGFNQIGGKAQYAVENGSIVGKTVKNTPNSFLVTDKEYSDFILELDLNVNEFMNSGVQFRSNSDPNYKNGRFHGYQMEIDPSSRGWSGGIYDEGRRGWLYKVDINEPAKTAFKNGQWNHYKIEAIGNTIRTWVNGVPVSCVIDDVTASGHIGLQVHSIYGDMNEGMEIRWKNIKIKTTNLIPSPVDEIPVANLIDGSLSEQEKAQGFTSLFNGESLDNFRAIHSTGVPKRWSIEDKTLKVGSSDGSETGNDIVTKKEYSAFELVFEFKLTDGANSGIKYFVDESVNSGGKSGIGLEYQVLDNEKHPDAKKGAAGNRTLSSLYDLIPAKVPSARFVRKIGEWNQGRLVVRPNNKIEHWLNGELVVEYTRGSPLFNALVERSKYKDYKNFGMAEKGHILLQDHGDTVYYKNIKIREL